MRRDGDLGRGDAQRALQRVLAVRPAQLVDRGKQRGEVWMRREGSADCGGGCWCKNE
jgi:hypothetical protein